MSGLIERLKRTESPAARSVLLRLRTLPHLARRGHVARRRSVERYLAAAKEPRLQIRAGPQALPGWLNSDVVAGDIYLDLGRRLPFPDSTFAFVFGEHVVEHLTERAGTALLAELQRVLRPEGVLRLTTPDLRKILALYAGENPVVSSEDYGAFLAGLTGKRYERPAQILNDYLRLWGHRYVYDEEDLTAKLHQAGFARVERVEPGESGHEALRGLERHGGAEWVNRAEAMTLEATKAPA